MIVEGRENIAKYLYMSNATLGRRLRKGGIPYRWAEARYTRGRRCMKMIADTDELDRWNREQEAVHGHQ